MRATRRASGPSAQTSESGEAAMAGANGGRMSLLGAKRTVSRAQVTALAALAMVSCLILGYLFTHRAAAKKVRYGLMIDAGSTGSRMHTFAFSPSLSGKLVLLSDDFYPVKPGLSSYKDAPNTAGASLLPLLERSRSLIPASRHAKTPVYLRATAGLRMTGAEASAAILDSVRATLQSSGFMFRDHWASILGGNDEGIYSWITVNYLLGREAADTVGTLEMGGGSAQVAFIPRAAPKPISNPECVVPEENISFSGQKMKLYTTSHLGYGLKKAKADMMTKLVAMNRRDSNPCLSKGAQEVEIPFASKVEQMTGTGAFKECEELIDSVLGKDAGNCTCGLCTYGAKFQPQPIKEYVAFAFYMERTVDIGLTSPITLADLRRKGDEVCSMTKEAVNKAYPHIANGQGVDLCFDLAFIHSHLHKGHGIPEFDETIKIHVVSKIKGVELGWALGAMFDELSKLDEEAMQQ